MRHILSARQFNKNQIQLLFDRADYFKNQFDDIKDRRSLADFHKGRQLCSIFFQPSTRTRISFETAAAKLGLGVVSTENARESSSNAKGETLEDAIRVLNQYDFDIIVMRHYEIGAAKRAAKVSRIPIINGGDGAGEHPTQALLDAYTIMDNHRRLDDLRVVIGGDVERSRTIRSLVDILAKFKNNTLTFVVAPGLKLRNDIKKMLKQKDIKFKETENMEAAFKRADVVYWNRIQKEYLKDPTKVKGFVISSKYLKTLPAKAIVMNPLPRVDEIHPSVDSDRRAKYFEQAGNGLYIRMALIDLMIRDLL